MLTINEISSQGLDLIFLKEIEFKDSLCGFDFVLEHLNGKQ